MHKGNEVRSVISSVRLTHAVIKQNLCCSLNVIGSHKLIGSDNFSMCGFVGVDMALLEEMCHCGGKF